MAYDKLNFKTYMESLEKPVFNDLEVYHAYITHPATAVTTIAAKYNKSVGEMYRIIGRHGDSPNRLKKHHHVVNALHGSGMSIKHIAAFTGYTPRNIRYITKKAI